MIRQMNIKKLGREHIFEKSILLGEKASRSPKRVTETVLSAN